jgi:peroxiredoxin
MIFLGINISNDKEALAKLFVEVYKLTYPVGRDVANSLVDLYKIEATPTTLLIDTRGRLADRVDGGMEGPELARRIEALLK